MATVIELAAAGIIQRLDPQLDYDEQELRTIYLAPRVAEFLGDVLPSLESFFDKETTAQQDFDELISVYASGLPLVFDTQFKAFRRRCFDSLQGGVWYLKTADLRIFGWFPAKDCFLAAIPDTFENVKTLELYEGRRNEVIHYRNQINLNEPKFIPGDNPNAVVSNFAFSD